MNKNYVSLYLRLIH
uniref:Uncharacterized protein n=1 Tax=Arundo donax TaxID=35708 RepID=A0A0A9BGQ8_ARUDO